MRFIAEDGEIFDTIEDCKLHEQESRDKNKKLDELKEKMNALSKEYKEVREEYNKLRGINPYNWSEFFEEFFN